MIVTSLILIDYSIFIIVTYLILIDYNIFIIITYLILIDYNTFIIINALLCIYCQCNTKIYNNTIFVFFSIIYLN